VRSDDQRSMAWKARRRLSRNRSSMFSDSQSEDQSRRLCSSSVWHILDTEHSGVASNEGIHFISALTTIATARADSTNGAAHCEPRASSIARILEDSKGKDGAVLRDHYFQTIEEQAVAYVYDLPWRYPQFEMESHTP
jgi:hypothetical protein